MLVQTLAEILSEREMISHLMEKIIDEATRPWGVKVERVEIKVIYLFIYLFIKIISFVRRNEAFYLPSKCSHSYETLFSFYFAGRESSSTITESHGSRS